MKLNEIRDRLAVIDQQMTLARAENPAYGTEPGDAFLALQIERDTLTRALPEAAARAWIAEAEAEIQKPDERRYAQLRGEQPGQMSGLGDPAVEGSIERLNQSRA